MRPTAGDSRVWAAWWGRTRWGRRLPFFFWWVETSSNSPPAGASGPGLVREGARRQADFGSEVVVEGVGPGGKTPAVEFAPALIT